MRIAWGFSIADPTLMVDHYAAALYDLAAIPLESDVGVTANGPDAEGTFAVAVEIEGLDRIAAARLSAALQAMTASPSPSP